jgi:hypothetical protein
MTLAADAKKVAAQFSKVAKLKTLTAQLREKYGTSITRKELKEFEKTHKLVVQWVARREAPSQTFRTPLGFARFGRATYAIPADPTVLVNETGIPVTVTGPEVLPDGDVSYGPAVDCRVPLSADEQAVASMLGLEQDKVAAHKDSTGV